MILAHAKRQKTNVLILGITQEHVIKLMEGTPISSPINWMASPWDEICILFGKTNDDIIAQLRPAVDSKTKVYAQEKSSSNP